MYAIRSYYALYLQFDGVDPELYEKIRGRKGLLDIKMSYNFV